MDQNKIEKAEILCVGTEILLGDIVNTDAVFLSRRLAELGISVYRQSVVGDNAGRLKDILAEIFSRSDTVIISGGLGPTCDDLTKETVAEFFGVGMRTDADSLRRMREYFAATGRQMTKNNEKQAEIPIGATVLTNYNGTAPGIIIEGQGNLTGKTAILLPGPPAELEPMFDESVLPYLRSRCENTIVSRNINIMGMGESAIEEKLRSLMNESSNPTIAPYAKSGEVRLRVSAYAHTESEALKMCNDMIERVKATEVGRFIYGIDVSSVENALLKALKEKGLTFACAESCTGGLIAKRITDIPGSSSVFVGGAVTYTELSKNRLANVSEATLAQHTAVSDKTAAEMARGIRQALSADIAVSTTGFAGPDGGTEQDPVGTVYIAVSTPDGEMTERLSLSSKRDRKYIREVASSRAILLALKRCLGSDEKTFPQKLSKTLGK